MKNARVLDIYDRPLAVLPSKLEMISAVYERHARGEKFDIDGLKAAMPKAAVDGNGPDEEGNGYVVQNGVAIIAVEGVIAKKMNLFTWFSGGMSTQILSQNITDAVDDPTVHSIVLSIDSPGGEVDGTQVAAQAIAEAEAKMPVVAFLDGMCASAAYWLASQCNEIFMADETTIVGSIGVVSTHIDRSKANEQAGKVVTDITAGKYKRIASSNAPLSVEGRASIQDQLDQIYSVFVDAVASGRDVPTDTVLSDMADGKVFIGQQAIDAGLVDGVSSLDKIVADLADRYMQQLQGTPNPNSKGNIMFKTFATEADYSAAIASATEQAVASARTEAATTERNRIKAVQEQQLSSAHSELITTLAFDGKTTGPEAAVAVLAAEKKIASSAAVALAADAKEVKVIPASEASASEEEKNAKERRDAAAAASAKADDKDPIITAAAIADHIQAEKAKGKKVGYAEAAAALAAVAKK